MEDEPEQESDRRRMYFLVLLPPPLPRPAEDFLGRCSSSCEMHVNEFPIFSEFSALVSPQKDKRMFIDA